MPPGRAAITIQRYYFSVIHILIPLSPRWLTLYLYDKRWQKLVKVWISIMFSGEKFVSTMLWEQIHIFLQWYVKLIMNYPFLNTNFALTHQGKCWKDDVVTFTANLSVTIKRLTRYKQKLVLAVILEGKSMPSNMAETDWTELRSIK